MNTEYLAQLISDLIDEKIKKRHAISTKQADSYEEDIEDIKSRIKEELDEIYIAARCND